MRRAVLRLAGLTTLVILSSGHVGSPDVWFEGNAGPYHVIVNIQVPDVIPGVADINVRVVDDTPDQITAMVNIFDANAGTPPPDVAKPLPGQDGWYGTKLWIMAVGSNGVTIEVKGAKGTGTVIIPVAAVASRRLPLERSLGAILAGLGLFLFAGIVTIAGAAVRESVLPPGESPGRERIWKARGVMAATTLVFGLLLFGGKVWWDAEDTVFVENIFRPFSAAASVSGGERLNFDIVDSSWVMRGDSSWLAEHGSGAWSPLVTDHGKLMHLFLVAESGMGAFAHLHPATTDSTRFTVPLPPLPAGGYRVYGDIVHESGFGSTLVALVELPGGGGVGGAADDGFYVGGGNPAFATLPDSTVVTWERGATRLVAGTPASLTFTVRDADSQPSVLDPYLGMIAHAVVANDDGSVFIHLHPMGTVSTASQETFVLRQSGERTEGGIGKKIAAGDSAMLAMGHPTATNRFSFPYAFPKAGRYRIWVQVRRGGEVQTAAFDAEVQ